MSSICLYSAFIQPIHRSSDSQWSPSVCVVCVCVDCLNLIQYQLSMITMGIQHIASGGSIESNPCNMSSTHLLPRMTNKELWNGTCTPLDDPQLSVTFSPHTHIHFTAFIIILLSSIWIGTMAWYYISIVTNHSTISNIWFTCLAQVCMIHFSVANW